jgi:hypothetical protein
MRYPKMFFGKISAGFEEVRTFSDQSLKTP